MQVKKEFYRSKNISFIFTVLFCSFSFVGIYLSNSAIGIIFWFLLLLVSLKNHYIPFAFIGASNYLPILLGVSPTIIGIIIMGIVILNSGIVSKKKLIIKISDKEFWVLLIVMTGWSFFTGIMYQDLSFFSSILTALIYSFVIFIYSTNLIENIEQILKYFILGLGIGLVFTLLIKMNVPGFVSYHPFRLAVGHRADPNSTGLLFAVLSIYFFINMCKYLGSNILTAFGNGVLFALSIICLFYTQSRGSVLCLLIGLVAYLIFGIKKAGKINKKTLRNIAIFCSIIIIVLCIEGNILEMLNNAWNVFFDRLTNAESGDGERGYLLKMSIYSFLNNPFMGQSLNTFESFAGHVPHNTFSDYMVTNGIVGIMFYLLFFIKPLFKIFIINKRDSTSLPFFCYLICVMNVLFYSASNEKLPFFLLIILSLTISKEKNEESYYEKNNVTWSN